MVGWLVGVFYVTSTARSFTVQESNPGLLHGSPLPVLYITYASSNMRHNKTKYIKRKPS